MTMFGAMIAVGTLSYDETDNGLAFLMTLPVDRKTYVREKYLFILICTAEQHGASQQFCTVSEKGRLVHLLSALPPAILLILIAGGYLLSAAGAICGVS